MCQIIAKPAGMTIPKVLIESTCYTNGDGFGWMRFNPDTKEVLMDKIYTGSDNDPDVIFPIMEAFHDEDVFFHFRYRTKGDISEESCHPFKIYEGNDRVVTLMHNGTISGYGTHNKVDSQDFGERFIGPLYDKFLKSGTRKPLDDELFGEIVQKFTGSDSKVILMDNTGSVHGINFDRGTFLEDDETKKKFWVSNTYSFNRGHRQTTRYGDWEYGAYGRTNIKTKQYQSYSAMGKDGEFFTNPNSIPWEEGEKGEKVTYNYGRTAGNSNGNFQHQAGNQTAIQRVGQSTSEASGTTTQTTNSTGTTTNRTDISKGFEIPMPLVRKSYWKDVLGLDEIEEVFPMTQDQIEELVTQEPDNAVLFIRDLISEMWVQALLDESPAEEEIDEEEDAEEVTSAIHVG